jgi:hypothetical protein
MKKLLFILTIACSASSVFAQKIELPADKLQAMLCKKWQTSYSMLGNMRIDKMPGAPTVTFEFRKDGTFVSTNDKSPDVAKGTWKYAPAKKMIQLLIDGRSNVTVVALTENELTMSADTKEATPDDPTSIIIVYKVSGS